MFRAISALVLYCCTAVWMATRRQLEVPTGTRTSGGTTTLWKYLEPVDIQIRPLIAFLAFENFSLEKFSSNTDFRKSKYLACNQNSDHATS